MNKLNFKLLVLLLIGIFYGGVLPSLAFTINDNDSYIVINGTVKNSDNHRRIEYANIAVKGTNIGTVANENGDFSLKIKNSLQADMIVVSHVGYVNSFVRLKDMDYEKVTVWLSPRNNVLHEVTVRSGEARQIVQEALHKIEQNYEMKDCMLTGFYRETARKRQHYINVSEAVVDVYKTTYHKRSADVDRVQVLQGRQLISEKKGDTLAVKLLGGPALSVFVDVVKNPDLILDDEFLDFYNFSMEDQVYVDHRMQIVVSFTPRVNLTYALYKGKLYIDSENLSFTRAELSLDMSDRNKATQAILKKKPAGVIFKPQELSFIVNYKERDGKMCLDYVRNEVKFKCDWKRKLFYTSYGIVSEMVVTDMRTHDVRPIPRRDSFSSKEIFSDQVSAFSDDDFWGAYNIIKPTESLDKAVNKLKKQVKDKE